MRRGALLVLGWCVASATAAAGIAVEILAPAEGEP